MTNRILSIVSFFGVTAALLALSPRAEAQCRPDDIFCAELRIGPAQPPPPPPPVVEEPPPRVVVQPPPVVVQQPPPPPQPPVVIVQPAQPPPPPPPRVVVVRPAPPPPPPPQVVHVQVERRRVVRRELVPEFDIGVHLGLAGLMTENVHMGGFQGAFRLRPIRHLAIDVGAGIFGGESQNYGPDSGGRWEVPVTADMLVFFNPQHRFQVYALVGVGVAVAGQETRRGERQLEYVGGEAGLGFEWRIGRHFALNLDIRGFLRQHVGDDGPEFVRTSETGELETTDLSGGAYGTFGMTFYFGR